MRFLVVFVAFCTPFISYGNNCDHLDSWSKYDLLNEAAMKKALERRARESDLRRKSQEERRQREYEFIKKLRDQPALGPE